MMKFQAAVLVALAFLWCCECLATAPGTNVLLNREIPLEKQVGDTTRCAARSCQQVAELRSNSVSGYYWVQSPNQTKEVYCFNNRRRLFGEEGGWMRVANVDMKHGDSVCPAGFGTTTTPRKLCKRTVSTGCSSATFPTHGIRYSKVCGRVIGYQQGTPDGFCPYLDDCAYRLRNGISTTVQSIEGGYVDGVSITHGSPRHHIWTFVAALGEGSPVVDSNPYYACPCTDTRNQYNYRIPSFVGNDYYCETADREGGWDTGRFYPEDPLWDGQGCGRYSSCCRGYPKPYFCKELVAPTTDDIEVRICFDESGGEDTLLEVIELYVQ